MDAVLRLIQDVYPGMEGATSVMQTGLQNANPMLHPAVTPANAVPGFGWATDTHRYKCRGHNPLRRPGAAVRLFTLYLRMPAMELVVLDLDGTLLTMKRLLRVERIAQDAPR